MAEIKENCAFYKLDEKAKTEHEAWESSMPESMRKQQAEEAAHFKKLHAELKAKKEAGEELDKSDLEMLKGFESSWNPTCKQCNEFCKHFKVNNGHPGETLYCCGAEGNKHIMGADFNESEVR